MNRLAICNSVPPVTFYIADWHVDSVAHQISRGSTSRRLEPKAMLVLVYLATRPGCVIKREELESSVWSGVVVGYDALTNAIIKIRKAFDDKVAQPRIIETISKSGYRLIAPVSGSSPEVTHDHVPGQHQALDEVIESLEVPQQFRNSIAILAFDNLGGDPEQEYFSDGITEDIITDLAQISGLFVVARNSSFSYKGKHTNLQTVSRELGVRFILEGSIRRTAEHLRICAQLIDGVSGGHVWAKRYDRDIREIFELQDEIRLDIVESLHLTLSAIELQRLAHRGTLEEQAYDFYLRGREQDQRDTRESNKQACSLLGKAIEIDPHYSNAYSHLSRNHAVCHINRWNDWVRNDLHSALHFGNKAIALDYLNPHAHFSVGAASLWLRQYALSLRETELAIEINQNFAEGHALLGMILMYMGRPRDAIPSLRNAMRLDPHYRDAYLHILGQAYFHSRQYALAVEVLERRILRKPETDTSRVLLAAAYGHLGELDRCRAVWAEALQINPDYSLQQRRKTLPYKLPSDFAHIEEGLRLASLP